MQAKVKRKGSFTIFELEGNIDFETAKPFRDQCTSIITKATIPTQIVFNMHGLKFVGSSGLSSFIQTLKEFNGLTSKPRFCGVGSEFKKIFKIYSPDEEFEIFASEIEAIQSFKSES